MPPIKPPAPVRAAPAPAGILMPDRTTRRMFTLACRRRAASRPDHHAERRISRAGRPVSCDRLSRNGSAGGGKSGAVAASDTAMPSTNPR